MTQADSRPFPAVHSILDPAALRVEVAERYALTPRSCELVRSWINEVYLLQAERAFILKVFRYGWRSPGEVAYETALMAHLAARGLTVAPPVQRRDGALIGVLPALEGERVYVLYPLLEGQLRPSPSEELYLRVGRGMATMHAALDSFHSLYPRQPLDTAYLVDQSLEWLRPHLQYRTSDWDFLTALGKRAQTYVEKLADDGLDWGPIHGDLTLDNQVLLADGSIGIYDFDQCGPGWRGYELQGVFHYAWQIARPGFWDALLEGYRAVRPLSDGDVAGMPAFVVLNKLWCMGFEAAVIARSRGRFIADEASLAKECEGLRAWAAAHPMILA